MDILSDAFIIKAREALWMIVGNCHKYPTKTITLPPNGCLLAIKSYNSRSSASNVILLLIGALSHTINFAFCISLTNPVPLLMLHVVLVSALIVNWKRALYVLPP